MMCLDQSFEAAQNLSNLAKHVCVCVYVCSVLCCHIYCVTPPLPVRGPQETHSGTLTTSTYTTPKEIRV